MTEDQIDKMPRAIVSFVTAAVALVVLVAADRIVDLPTIAYYLGIGYLATIIAVSVFRQGLFENPDNRRRYVVRRHYLDSDVEYVTRSRHKALEYARDLLDGMVDFINDNPQSKEAIVNEYTVSIAVPRRQTKHVPDLVVELRDALTDKLIGFMLDHKDMYSMMVTTAITKTAEIRISLEQKESSHA
jgi:hypothetical protein